jgi:hypothetical protein
VRAGAETARVLASRGYEQTSHAWPREVQQRIDRLFFSSSVIVLNPWELPSEVLQSFSPRIQDDHGEEGDSKLRSLTPPVASKQTASRAAVMQKVRL